MHMLDYYRGAKQREELRQILMLMLGAQKHEDGLLDFSLGKDLWAAAWEQSISSGSQIKKFRKRQSAPSVTPLLPTLARV